MSTIRVVNLQHTDATEPNIVLESDGTATFVSGITISGGTNLTVSGVAEFASGTVSAPTITFIDDNNTGIYEPAVDTVAITTAATERLRVDSSGRLLVGTSSSLNTAYKLQIAGESDAAANVACFRGNATGQSLLALTKSRTGTIGNHTIVQDDDNIGAIQFRASDGTDYITGASIEVEVDGTPGTNDMPGRLVFSTNSGTSSPTERLRIDSSGNVGIGTTSASSILTAGTGTGTNAITINGSGSSTSVNQLIFYGGGTNNPSAAIEYDGADKGIAFQIGNYSALSSSEVARIDTSGRLLVGTTTSNAAPLTVEGNVEANSSRYRAVFGNGYVDSDSSTLGGSSNIEVQIQTSSSSRPAVLSLGGGQGTNEPLGGINFFNSGNTDGSRARAQIYAFQEGSNTDQGGVFTFRTASDGGATPTERMRIDSSGSVIIKDSTGADSITFRHDGSNGSIVNNGGEFLFYAEGSQNMIFHTNSTERMRINSSGNVGVGTSNPGVKFVVEQGAAPSGFSQTSINILRSNYGGQIAGYIDQGVTHGLTFSTVDTGTATERMRIDGSGRLLYGLTSARSNFYNSTNSANVQIGGYSDTALVREANDIFGSAFILAKSRSTANTIVQNNDTVALITAQGNDGSQFVECGNIKFEVDGTPGADDMPGRLVLATTADGASSPTERMRITSDGVIKTTNTNTYGNTAGNYNEINYSGGSASLIVYARDSSTPYGYFYNSPNADPNNTSVYVFRATQNTGVNIYTIATNGTVSARSDARYKKNIETTRDGYLEDLSQLRVVKYNWYNHEDDAPKELGLIAQEVEEVFPGLVLNEPEQDAEGNDTGEVCKSIKFSVFTPMLIKALQEAQDRIETLEAKVAALEAK